MSGKSAKIKRRSADWVPSERDLAILTNRLEETGQKYILSKEPASYEKVCEEYVKLYPMDDRGSLNFRYFTLVNYLRYIFTKYRIEFIRFVSNPKWIFPVDTIVDTFFHTGYVPDKYKCSEGQGGFFKWVENATIELVLMSRGCGKTTKWTCMRAVWEVVRNPSFKWLVVHSDKEKALGLISAIKEIMINPYLSVIFPDLFDEDPKEFKKRTGNILTKEKINVVTYNEETEEFDDDGFSNFEYRKEATFTVGSPQIDRTGMHFEGVFADDLVTDITSKSKKDTKQLISYFRSLFAMKQYRDDWIFMCYMTGTEWWENSLYTEVKTWPNVSVFELPAQWDYQGDDCRLCRYFTDRELASQRIEQGEWFNSQMLMMPRPYEGGELEIGFSLENNVIEMTYEQLMKLKEEHMVAQICDPSFTRKNKKEGDTKSRFSIIHSIVDETRYMIYNAWQTFGMDSGGIKDVNIQMAKKENVDFFIQDAQAQQTGIFDEQIRVMRRELPYLDYFKHTKSLGSKVEIANKVLSLICEMREFIVVRIINDPDDERRKFIEVLINQLLGIGGLDFVDCCTMMVSDIDRDVDVRAARLRKNLKNNKRGNFKKISLRTPSSVFGASGGV